MKSAVLDREHKAVVKPALSMFDPRRNGTDEDTLLKKHRPDLYELKKNPSEKYRLARRLFELRTEAGLSQTQLAAKAGIGPATYQRIEECQPIANPSLDVLVKLSHALDVDVQALFGDLESDDLKSVAASRKARAKGEKGLSVAEAMKVIRGS